MYKKNEEAKIHLQNLENYIYIIFLITFIV